MVLSIHVTVAVVLQVFPIASMRLNVKLPFHVKVYVSDHQLLVIVIQGLENESKVAMTSSLVAPVILYATTAVGGVVSIRETVAIVDHMLPAKSWKVKSKLQFHVKT